MIHNKNFPAFLKGFNFSFMPVYCRKNRNLYLIDEKLWNAIHYKVSYIRARTKIHVNIIKGFNFVYPVTESAWRTLTIQHITFLRNLNLLVSHIKLNPLDNPHRVIVIESCHFIHYFQRLNVLVHRHIKWRRFFWGRRIRRRIRLGFYRENYYRPIDDY